MVVLGTQSLLKLRVVIELGSLSFLLLCVDTYLYNKYAVTQDATPREIGTIGKLVRGGFGVMHSVEFNAIQMLNKKIYVVRIVKNLKRY